jgi:hypothetical protein
MPVSAGAVFRGRRPNCPGTLTRRLAGRACVATKPVLALSVPVPVPVPELGLPALPALVLLLVLLAPSSSLVAPLWVDRGSVIVPPRVVGRAL